jgi:FMN hydrolase / 5-amino-6-(5-phospho-D-ribitylamino)uracil phosphatase
MVKALSFDADQTLWDFRGVEDRALAATIAAMVERGDTEPGSVDVECLKRVRAEVAERFRGRPHRLEDVRRESFRVVLERAGHGAAVAAADALIEIFLDIRFGEIRLYPEVRESLLRLAPRYRLGLLSNGNTDPQRCGLPGVFDAVVLGPDHGFEKPNPRAFETIARELGVEPGSLLHVGDGRDDIEGANGIGATSVFINRDGVDPSFRAEADHEVRDLIELEALLFTGLAA